jgi:hypothetical protein
MDGRWTVGGREVDGLVDGLVDGRWMIGGW